MVSDNKKILISNFKKPLVMFFDYEINNVCSLSSPLLPMAPHNSELHQLIYQEKDKLLPNDLPF